MRNILIFTALATGLLAAPAFGQTANQQPQPNLSSDMAKPQQNSADEATIKSKLEDGLRPGDVQTQGQAARKIEDAAVEAKRKSDAKTGTTGSEAK